ncbi:MAG: hypothetical protein WEB58_10465 [Planctomycetaceae bacterium]
MDQELIVRDRAIRNVTRWAVGMTTAPRDEPALVRSVASLAEAGWGQPRLFVEPESGIPPQLSHLPMSSRDSRLGAFPNWYLGLTELYLREPRAEAYLMCQDDVLFSVGLRDYLERTLWPAPQVGIVSLYCPSHYAKDVPSGYYIENHGWASWGALAYVFSNPGLRQLLSDRLFVDHRHCGPANGAHNIDSIVGKWCGERSLPYYVHMPSLAQHIGDTSTIFQGATNRGRRKASQFLERV